MKSLDILRLLVQDAALNCSVNTGRDWLTIQSRVENEGLSFLTITLPRFTTWLEQSLEESLAQPTIFPVFHRKTRGGGSLPAFLWGLTSRIFDPVSGRLRDNADPSAVYFIRQICSFFKKVKLPCTARRNEDTIEKFLATDAGLPKRDTLDRVGQSVANYIVLGLKYSEQDSALALPKHGPGATFEKTWGNQKYVGREYYARWMGAIDVEDLYGFSAILDDNNTFKVIQPRDELPCRLSLVPKTLKAPRTIAVEPVAMQYAQQLVSSRLIAAMGAFRLTRHLDFADQAKNRELARLGSQSGKWSTIDLSEASDRISSSLVREIVRSDPLLSRQLFAARSSKIRVRSRGVSKDILLRKFSTSGSAITFPVETLVFFILAVTALVRLDKTSTSLVAAIHRAATEVSVYGDDIIAPSSACTSVIQELEVHNLKVNRSKTFHKGFFRESCGGDYFRGYDVTPKYLRALLPESRADSSSFASSVSTGNQLFLAGCWRAASGLRDIIDLIFPFPLVARTSPGLGWFTYQNGYQFSRRRDSFGEHVVRTWKVTNRAVDNVIDGFDALLKHFLSKAPPEDSEHLSKSTRQFASTTRLTWVRPY